MSLVIKLFLMKSLNFEKINLQLNYALTLENGG